MNGNKQCRWESSSADMIFSDRTTIRWIAELKTSIFFPNEYAMYSLTANFNNTFDMSPKIFSHMCQLCLIESRGGGAEGI